jgi:TonB family protein
VRLFFIVLLALTFVPATFAQVSQQTPDVATQISTDSTKLVPIKTQKADYPDAARAKGIQGQVVVKVEINEAGEVEHAEVVSGDPLLTDAALNAAKKWKFKPFIRDGKPTKVNTNLPFDFAFTGKIVDVPRHTIAAGSAPGDGIPRRIRVSPGVSEGLLLHQVRPVYPEAAKFNGIQGHVVMRALIGKEGRIIDLKVVSGPLELADAAMGAVQQWRYRPYLLNGEPVTVETTIDINFTLGR